MTIRDMYFMPFLCFVYIRLMMSCPNWLDIKTTSQCLPYPEQWAGWALQPNIAATVVEVRQRGAKWLGFVYRHYPLFLSYLTTGLDKALTIPSCFWTPSKTSCKVPNLVRWVVFWRWIYSRKCCSWLYYWLWSWWWHCLQCSSLYS